MRCFWPRARSTLRKWKSRLRTLCFSQMSISILFLLISPTFFYNFELSIEKSWTFFKLIAPQSHVSTLRRYRLESSAFQTLAFKKGELRGWHPSSFTWFPEQFERRRLNYPYGNGRQNNRGIFLQVVKLLYRHRNEHRIKRFSRNNRVGKEQNCSLLLTESP